MPRYFFHIRNGNGLTCDEEGQELADVRVAKRVAVASARSLLAAEAAEGIVDLRGRIEVADAAGTIVARTAFADVIEFRTGSLPDDDA